MPDELVEIATYWTSREAAIARTALEGHGVRCFMKDDQVVDMLPLIANAVGSVKVLVAAADAERAREILATAYDDWPSEAETWICPRCGQPVDARLGACGECRAARPGEDRNLTDTAEAALDDSAEARRQARNPYAPPRAAGQDTPDAPAGEPDDDRYARCPECEQPRTAACPFCQTSGDRFKVAFTFEEAPTGAGPAMLICPTCDEPFEPEYLRHCEGCGHDFGAGRDAPPVASQQEPEPHKLRVLAVALAAIALVVGLLMYFAMLLQ